MQTQQLTLGRFIDLAIQMEKQAYDFYKGLEEMYKDNTDLAECFVGIKEDESKHVRILLKIKESLSDIRLLGSVPESAVQRIQNVLEYQEKTDFAALNDADAILDAMRGMEDLEFDVVMEFVDADEIDFELTSEYLKNETIDHANRIFRAQQCLD